MPTKQQAIDYFNEMADYADTLFAGNDAANARDTAMRINLIPGELFEVTDARVIAKAAVEVSELGAQVMPPPEEPVAGVEAATAPSGVVEATAGQPEVAEPGEPPAAPLADDAAPLKTEAEMAATFAPPPAAIDG